MHNKKPPEGGFNFNKYKIIQINVCENEYGEDLYLLL